MSGAVTPIAGRSVELDDMTARMIDARRTQIQQAAEVAKTRADAPRAPEQAAAAAGAATVRRSEVERPTPLASATAQTDRRAAQDAGSGRPALSAEVRSLLQADGGEPAQTGGSEMRLIRDLLDTIRAYERDGAR